MLRMINAQMEPLLRHNDIPVHTDVGHTSLRENQPTDAPGMSGQHNDELGDTKSEFREDY